MAKVTLENNGLKKQVKVGFSWTTFFFGGWVPLLRGDLKWFIILGIASLLAGVCTVGLGAFIPGLVMCFKYNGIYIKELVEKGWKPATEEDKNTLIVNKIVLGDIKVTQNQIEE